MDSPNGGDNVSQRPPAANHHHRNHHCHVWTTFEFDIMLALICKGVHNHGIVEFATKFNEGLNGAVYGRQVRDVDMEEIQDMLVYILDKKKAAVAFVERQVVPRVTRAQKRVFMRNIDFTGTVREWEVDGRRDVEALEHPQRIKRMLERQQKEQFLEDFERRVEEQGMQRDHQRLTDTLDQRRVTRHETPTPIPRASDDFRYVRRDSSDMLQSIMTRSAKEHHEVDASANGLDSRTSTYLSGNGAQHQQSTTVVSASGRSVNWHSEVDSHAQGGYIHEMQSGLGTNTRLSDVSQTAPASTNGTFDATNPGAHVKDNFRPVQEEGQGFPPFPTSAMQNFGSTWQGGFAEQHLVTTPNGQPTSGSDLGGRENRQPRFEMTGRYTPLQGTGSGRGQIGGFSPSMSREDDRQCTVAGDRSRPNLATPFADLQAQPPNEEGIYRNSRKEGPAPGDNRTRARLPDVDRDDTLPPRDLQY